MFIRRFVKMLGFVWAGMAVDAHDFARARIGWPKKLDPISTMGQNY